MKDIPVIKCPVCGEEYMIGDVFMPNKFFGRQTEIVKKPSGEIDYYLGEDPDLNEEFICENCLTKLKIKANITFNIEQKSQENFDEEYTTSINKPIKIKLSEEELF